MRGEGRRNLPGPRLDQRCTSSKDISSLLCGQMQFWSDHISGLKYGLGAKMFFYEIGVLSRFRWWPTINENVTVTAVNELQKMAWRAFKKWAPASNEGGPLLAEDVRCRRLKDDIPVLEVSGYLQRCRGRRRSGPRRLRQQSRGGPRGWRSRRRRSPDCTKALLGVSLLTGSCGDRECASSATVGAPVACPPSLSLLSLVCGPSRGRR